MTRSLLGECGSVRRRSTVGAATATVALAIVLATLVAGCSRPLPEAESPAARLYVARCGTCHAAYGPHTLTPAMWKYQVDRMDQRYREARLPVPVGAEREQILDYLIRHAGG